MLKMTRRLGQDRTERPQRDPAQTDDALGSHESRSTGGLSGTGGLPMVFSLLDTGNPNFPIVTPKDPPLPSMDAPKQPAASADDEVLGRVWQLARPLLRGC